MRKIVAVMDDDSVYARKLAEYLNEKGTLGMKCICFSGFGELRGMKDTRAVIVLNGKENDEAGTDGACTRAAAEGAVNIILSSSRIVRSGAPAVFKYDKAENILRRILAIYAENDEGEMSRIPRDRARITAVASPVGRCGKTEFALTLGLMLSEEGEEMQRKVLMISLDEYAGVFRFLAAEAVSDMSDVIYAFRQNARTWARLEHCIYDFGNLRYIPPVRYARDIMEISAEDFAALISVLCTEGGFDEIILDIGSYGKRGTELLELCDVIYLPLLPDAASRCKVDEYFEELENAGRSDIAGRIRKVDMPESGADPDSFGRMKLEPEEYLEGKTAELVRKLLGEGIVQGA